MCFLPFFVLLFFGLKLLDCLLVLNPLNILLVASMSIVCDWIIRIAQLSFSMGESAAFSILTRASLCEILANRRLEVVVGRLIDGFLGNGVF